jgi:hypothetical protein
MAVICGEALIFARIQGNSAAKGGLMGTVVVPLVTVVVRLGTVGDSWERLGGGSGTVKGRLGHHSTSFEKAAAGRARPKYPPALGAQRSRRKADATIGPNPPIRPNRLSRSNLCGRLLGHTSFTRGNPHGVRDFG